jgi:hypothetical protein
LIASTPSNPRKTERADMDFRNTTHVDSELLLSSIHDAIEGWPSDKLIVRVRYSRGAEFSGTCYYGSNRIFVNLGRQNKYPYRLLTHIARPRANRTHWWRELYSVDIASADQLVLFVFLHEFYHWLVKQARRNVRQKEGRCDRFATRVLVDRYGAQVRDASGRPVSRSTWDFQDLDGFVAAARRKRQVRPSSQLLLPTAAATKPAKTVSPESKQTSENERAA